MKRPASTRSLLTVPFAIPAYWTPDQALAVVELLDGLRELIWARSACSCWMSVGPNFSPWPTVCLSLDVAKNRPTK
jgi:hypothetical protein